MKYIIMCGGNYHTDIPRHLQIIKGEPIVARTIRLLRENNITDISISATDDRFNQFDVPVLKHNNRYGDGGLWIDGFYPVKDPACYIFGDVVFSPNAIKTIVNTDTRLIQFFASSPPFADEYTKEWAEPFAFKVRDQVLFRNCINRAIELHTKNIFKRQPLSWELWQVIKGTPYNEIDYHNYHIINDYTCDVDYPGDLEKIERFVK